MRPYNSPTSIKLQNASYATQYCPTPPLPPSITDRPWWERLRERQGNSKSQSGVDPKSTQSSTQNPVLKSPASKETYLRKSDPQPVADVQTGKTTFMGVPVKPGCPPELPAEYRFSHRVVQKRSGQWCFLPLIYDTVPESWCWTHEDRAFIDSGFPETAPPVSETVNQSRLAPEYSEIGHALTEDGIEESASVSNPPHPAMQIRTTEMQEAKNTSFSDHPITGSPDLLRRARLRSRRNNERPRRNYRQVLDLLPASTHGPGPLDPSYLLLHRLGHHSISQHLFPR